MRDLEAIAENLVAARRRCGLTLVELASAAQVSKSTVHDIERGAGNPRLDTLYAIAGALDMTLGDLIADRAQPVQVTRADEGAVVVGNSVTARLMQRITDAGDIEVYDVALSQDRQQSEPHRTGTTECLIVHSGTVEVGPTDQLITLRSGESVWFASDQPHSYRSVTDQATATLLVVNGYPRG